jgi:hypothetical protein
MVFVGDADTHCLDIGHGKHFTVICHDTGNAELTRHGGTAIDIWTGDCQHLDTVNVLVATDMIACNTRAAHADPYFPGGHASLALSSQPSVLFERLLPPLPTLLKLHPHRYASLIAQGLMELWRIFLDHLFDLLHQLLELLYELCHQVLVRCHAPCSSHLAGIRRP